jgi:hypothetical protein
MFSGSVHQEISGRCRRKMDQTPDFAILLYLAIRAR